MTAADGLTQVNTLATHTALSAWAWGTDFFIVIVMFLAFFLFAMYIGKGAFIGMLLSFYAAYGAYVLFPYKSLFSSGPATANLLESILLYAIFASAFYLVLHRVISSDFVYIGIFGRIILSFLGAGFLLALAYHVFPVTKIYTFTPAVDALFAPKEFFFWWFIAPLVGLFFLAR